MTDALEMNGAQLRANLTLNQFTLFKIETLAEQEDLLAKRLASRDVNLYQEQPLNVEIVHSILRDTDDFNAVTRVLNLLSSYASAVNYDLVDNDIAYVVAGDVVVHNIVYSNLLSRN